MAVLELRQANNMESQTQATSYGATIHAQGSFGGGYSLQAWHPREIAGSCRENLLGDKVILGVVGVKIMSLEASGRSL